MHPTQYLDKLTDLSEQDHLPLSELRPVPATDIMAVERELGFELPSQYIDFLCLVGVGSELGVARWHHLDLGRSGNLLSLREEWRHPQLEAMRAARVKMSRLPRGFLPIYDPCDGEVFGLVPASRHKFKQAVYCWDTETFELWEVAKDFNDFLDYLSSSEDEGQHLA